MQRVWEGHDVSHGQVQTAAGLPVREQTFHWPAPQSRYRTDRLAPGWYISLTQLTGIHCVHYIEQKDCTGGVRRRGSMRHSLVKSLSSILQLSRPDCTWEDHSIPTLREDRSIPTLWCALCTAGKDEGKVVMWFLLFFSSSDWAPDSQHNRVKKNHCLT